MQSYVATRFGSLRNESGQEFVSPYLDDIKISSETLELHIRDVRRVKGGLEFKLTKWQFNQEKIEFWGYVCDANGRRVQLKKVEQLETWPIPEDRESLNYFIAS
jgi:hypothetical protein